MNTHGQQFQFTTSYIVVSLDLFYLASKESKQPRTNGFKFFPRD